MATNAKDSAKDVQKGKPKSKNIFARVGRSFRDLRGEVKKVVWPSKKQIINNTIVVIVIVVLSAVVIGGFDTLFGLLLKLCFGS